MRCHRGHVLLRAGFLLGQVLISSFLLAWDYDLEWLGAVLSPLPFLLNFDLLLS